MPGSPTSSSSWPCPSAARVIASPSSASSPARPIRSCCAAGTRASCTGGAPAKSGERGRPARKTGGNAAIIEAAMDYYQVLGVGPEASTEEIERAYRTLARQGHPHRNVGDADAEARMKQLNEIRAILTDPLLRTAYDDQQRAAAPSTAPAPAPEAPRPPVPWPV